MSTESFRFVPAAQRERTDYFYQRNILQAALAKEWLKTNSDNVEDDWLVGYHGAFKQLFPSNTDDLSIQADVSAFIAYLKEGSAEDISIKLAELQARLDKVKKPTS